MYPKIMTHKKLFRLLKISVPTFLCKLYFIVYLNTFTMFLNTMSTVKINLLLFFNKKKRVGKTKKMLLTFRM